MLPPSTERGSHFNNSTYLCINQAHQLPLGLQQAAHTPPATHPRRWIPWQAWASCGPAVARPPAYLAQLAYHSLNLRNSLIPQVVEQQLPLLNPLLTPREPSPLLHLLAPPRTSAHDSTVHLRRMAKGVIVSKYLPLGAAKERQGLGRRGLGAVGVLV